jgi:predicted NBD/HSP70 family sugar kinase/putative N-acetylmannosamine-6-phosphate epimerase
MSVPAIFRAFQGRLIVSCQAPEGDEFHDSQSIARFARVALAGGAAAIRANGPEDIKAVRNVTDAPIVGIQKAIQQDGQVLITPSFEAARALVEAGANLIALDCTLRGQRYGALDRVGRIRTELKVPVLADIATAQEAVAAQDAGADAVLSTLRGYSAETAHILEFEPEFIRQLASLLDIPVLAEGRIATPEQARQAIAAGAFSVVVGTAITRPGEIARSFAQAVERQHAIQEENQYFIGIDLGGTNTKFGIVSSRGDLLFEGYEKTPAAVGRDALLIHLELLGRAMARRAAESDLSVSGIGVATAGWVNNNTGRVAYATETMPGWTGTPIAEFLAKALHMPVSVENDANALAIAEKYFGAAVPFQDFVCITLGTGVGGGCYVRGELNRGTHFFANAVGHITVVPDGRKCNCGQNGCLEAYCNPAALLSYADRQFPTPEALIRAANGGDPSAVAAVRTFARYLARGCSVLLQLLDPEALIISGGLAQGNPLLLSALERDLSEMVSVWSQRDLAIIASPLGYYGGVLGAAAVAIEHQIR